MPAGGVTLLATGPFRTTMIAGSVGADGSAGIGVAKTTLVHPDTVAAYVDATDIISVAGSLAGGGVGVGVGADVGVITKHTNAYINSGVTATVRGNITVDA